MSVQRYRVDKLASFDLDEVVAAEDYAAQTRALEAVCKALEYAVQALDSHYEKNEIRDARAALAAAKPYKEGR